MNASAWEMSLIGDGNQSEIDGNKQAGVIEVDRNTFLFHANSIGFGPTAQFFKRGLIPSRTLMRTDRCRLRPRTAP
jgi:hypothetical protein